jgi:hypothetical protein
MTLGTTCTYCPLRLRTEVITHALRSGKVPAKDLFQDQRTTGHAFRKRRSGAMSSWILIPGACAWIALILILAKARGKLQALGFGISHLRI